MENTAKESERKKELLLCYTSFIVVLYFFFYQYSLVCHDLPSYFVGQTCYIKK